MSRFALALAAFVASFSFVNTAEALMMSLPKDLAILAAKADAGIQWTGLVVVNVSGTMIG